MKSNYILSQDQLALLCKELYLILSSSIGIVEGMESIIEGTKSKEAKASLRLSLNALQSNHSLSTALEMSGLFSDYMISMIEIGETTGKLDQVMLSLANYYEKDAHLKKQIKDGTTYPLVVALMVTIVIGVLVVKVLPIFAQVFENLGGSIPSTVDFVTGVGRIIVAGIILLFLAVLLAVGGFMFLYKSEQGRVKARKLFAVIPGIKNIYASYQTAQFANSLSLLVSSGYDLHNSLEMTQRTIEDQSYKDKIKRAIAQLEKGESLYMVLEQMKVFKSVHAQVIKLSVQTGHLDSVLNELSEKYTTEVDDSISSLIGIIEPTLVGATSFIIGGILLTVMLPLVGIMSAIG